MSAIKNTKGDEQRIKGAVFKNAKKTKAAADTTKKFKHSANPLAPQTAEQFEQFCKEQRALETVEYKKTVVLDSDVCVFCKPLRLSPTLEKCVWKCLHCDQRYKKCYACELAITSTFELEKICCGQTCALCAIYLCVHCTDRTSCMQPRIIDGERKAVCDECDEMADFYENEEAEEAAARATAAAAAAESRDLEKEKTK